MRFFKMLILLHATKLIVICLIAIIYLAATNKNNSNKTEVMHLSDSIVNEDSITNEETKGFSVADVEFITPPSQANYDSTTESDKK
jgi:hypothetical protein